MWCDTAAACAPEGCGNALPRSQHLLCLISAQHCYRAVELMLGSAVCTRKSRRGRVAGGVDVLDICLLAQVSKSLAREYGSLLHFVKEDLARQEYVMNVANEELQAALNVVLEENMYLGQVLFYCLDRLFLQVLSPRCIELQVSRSCRFWPSMEHRVP